MAMTGMTTELVEKAIRGKAPIILFGGVFCDALDRAELEEFERAKVRGYVVCWGKRDYLWTAWWCWCQATGHPYAAVKPNGRRYAWVEFELTSLWHEFSPEGELAAGDALWQHTRRGGFGHGPRQAGHAQVPKESAEALAVELLRIARQHTVIRDPDLQSAPRSGSIA
jgi:hypothetical protein